MKYSWTHKTSDCRWLQWCGCEFASWLERRSENCRESGQHAWRLSPSYIPKTYCIHTDAIIPPFCCITIKIFAAKKKTKTYLVDTFFRLKSRFFFHGFRFFSMASIHRFEKRVSSSPATLCCWRTESSPTFTQLHSAGSDWAAPPVLGPWHGTFSKNTYPKIGISHYIFNYLKYIYPLVN